TGGVAYVYLCYGIHYLLNVVTHQAGEPEAVLIRAGEPLEGLDDMLRRRSIDKPHPRLTSGPGALAAALGIGPRHNGLSFQGPELMILDDGFSAGRDAIIASAR